VSGVLDGVRVAVVGPDDAGDACAGLLAELGAAVSELDWADLERGSLAGAEIVLEGPAAPPALRGRELGAATIRCRLTPFGDSGPLADAPGSELTVQALAGLLSVTGYPSEPPTRIGPPVFAHAAALFALIGILAALEERDGSGRGQTVEVAAFDCAVAYLAPYVPLCLRAGKTPESQGNRGTTTVPWDLFPTADGQVVICTSTDAQWQLLLELAGREELAEDDRFATVAARLANVEQVDEIVASWTRRHPTERVLQIASERRIPAGVVRDLAEVRESRPIGTPVLRHPNPAATPTTDSNCHTDLFHTPVGKKSVPRSFPPGDDGGGDGAPLAGLRVVEIGHYTAGPYCGRVLGGLGAEVVKIEPLQGEPMRQFRPLVAGDGYFFHLNNAGKESIRLDLRSEEGLATGRALLAEADVLVENMGAGSLERLGLGYEELRAVNPGLIYCSVKGFGAASRRLALDTIIQAEGGMMAATGHPASGPVRAGISISDALGSTLAAADVLVALRVRRLSGEGSFVDVSMLDGTAWSTDPIPAEAPLPLGNRHPTRAPQGVFEGADGEVAIAVESDAQWRALVSLAGLASGPARSSHAERLAAAAAIELELGTWLSGQDIAEAVAACRAAGVPAAPVQSVAAALADPQVVARGMLPPVAFAGQDEDVRLLRLPLGLSRSPLPEPVAIGLRKPDPGTGTELDTASKRA
jgi:crotonobetainyl-CoA:carnitine CoA-transferase CaiB-like acyl-CoA transferase